MTETGGENIEKLVRMGNQIGAFFKSYPEQTAVEGVREHIARFWTTKMRAAFLNHLAAGGDGVDALVAKAATGLKK
ncbi:formate dehydrogenase subunit delta [Terrarubrum flagellatum]|uniref:formate dehydrogenase subunit delta n=1 Tax=Terrirubrum flagellatum TaxID=2895980 RepID=UPI003144E8B6